MQRVFLIASLALLATPALAQQQTTPAAPHHRSISQVFISPMGEPFRGEEGEPYPSIVWFKAANAAGDGSLTRAEFMADAVRFFKVLDKNGDGVLDESEIHEYETRIAPEVNIDISGPASAANQEVNWDDLRGPNNEPPVVYTNDDNPAFKHDAEDAKKAFNSLAAHRGAGLFSVIDQPEPVRAADTNIDFRVSMKEWLAAADRRFTQLDIDHKGKITFDQLPKTPIQLAAGQPRRKPAKTK